MSSQVFRHTLALFILLTWSLGFAQPPLIRVAYHSDEMDSTTYSQLLKAYGQNKILPEGHEKEALIALSYFPELIDAKVKFKYKKGGAPFASRPVVWDTFFKKPEKRTYLVFIRTKLFRSYPHLLLEKIPYNALIGVLGHELGHTSDFYSKRGGAMLGVSFGNLSGKYLDKFEYENDRRTIEHGLGFQLLDWNSYGFGDNHAGISSGSAKVDKMIENERYMHPSTIKEVMTSLELYQPFIKNIIITGSTAK